MGILDFLTNLLRDWNIDTRYEFYRVLYKEQNIDLIDYQTIMLVNSSIKNMKSYSTDDKNNYAFCTDKLKIRKSERKKLEYLKEYYSSPKFINSIVLKNDRLRMVELILNNFNKKDLIRIYLFTKNDVNYVINQFSKSPKEAFIINLIDYLDKCINIESTRRALICSVVYMYENEGLSISLKKQCKVYFTRDRLIRIRDYLLKIIKTGGDI